MWPAVSFVAGRVEELARSRQPVVVAVDGRSGSGKSTLSAQLARVLDAAVVDGDDFYRDLPDAERRSVDPALGATRFFDLDRLRDEALLPLRDARPARYRAYDWDAGAGLTADERQIAPRPVIIVDQVYSGHPALRDLVDLSVLVVTDDARRWARLAARGSGNASWHSLWEAAEDHYFTQVRVAESFDLVVDGTAISGD